MDVDPSRTGAPEGDAYEWFHRAKRLLSEGNPDAAVVLLERVQRTDATPAVAETLGRALFEARRYDEAIDVLTELVEQSPNDDYRALRSRQWPCGADNNSPPPAIICRWAFVMRPDRAEYGQALGQVKATLRAAIRGGIASHRTYLGRPTGRTRLMVPVRTGWCNTIVATPGTFIDTFDGLHRRCRRRPLPRIRARAVRHRRDDRGGAVSSVVRRDEQCRKRTRGRCGETS